VIGIVLAEALPAVLSAVIFTGLVQIFGKVAVFSPSPSQASRRRLILQGLGIVGVLAFGGTIWEVFQRGLLRPGPSLRSNTIPDDIPPPTPDYTDIAPVAQQTPEITSTHAFYYVSKNITSDPDVKVGNWQLTISGSVQHPYALSYAELQHLPAVERYQTLACISNEVGGPYISTGKFRGARLADILNAAGLQPDARELIFHAADGYSDSLHLAQALAPETLVVYALNDAPLTRAHGFPARLLIPGLYGMKNGKWLTSLNVGTGGYQGYWEQRGWTHEAVIKTMSRIDTPVDGDRITIRPTIIAGIAFAGDRGISRVDVTVDGGATWRAAQMRRPLNALTWTLWQYSWTPTPGDHVIGVRAIDGQGHVQTQQTAAPLPDGASGYQAILVTVT
jgi:DMSO/TMAO reductase YedYZ molybdopterin-dependent catalytic subunit